MRLLMLNNEFPPLGGGTGTVNRAVLRRLARYPDLEIDLITSALGEKPEQERFSERIQLWKVPVNNQDIHHSSNRELLTYAARALPLALRLHQTRPYDLCFAWSALPAGGVALALRHLVGLRYLVRISGPDIPGFEQRYRWLYPALTPAIRSIWRGAERVVAKCEGEAALLRAVDRRPALTLIPNGVSRAAFPPGPPTPNGGPLRLLCVARLIERKGQSQLIEALRRLVAQGHDLQLTLVGSGDARAAYEAQVRQAELGTRVTFAGYVPRERVADQYASAHVFVLPSFNEGMSVATLEAMAAGLPLIVTRTGGTDELVVEGENGFVYEWGDIDALTTHLRRLATDRARARWMGAASRRRAARFGWEQVVERYVGLMEELVTVPGVLVRGAAH